MKKLAELKQKYGFKHKLIAADFNDIRFKNYPEGKYVHAYTAHVEPPPEQGEEVIVYQGDDAVWIKGIVRDEPEASGKHFDSLGYRMIVDLIWDDYGYIDEYTFSDWR